MPVTGLVGLPGSGKTLRLVQLADEARAKGKDVYANFRLGGRKDGYLVPLCPWRAGEELRPAIACLGPVHATHEPHGYQYVERSMPWDVKAELYGLRRGKGFVPDPRAFLLTSWEQVVAIRVARDEFGVAHRLELARGEDVETKEGTEQTWSARPTCDVWRCNGCSRGITIALDELNLWAPSRFWEKLGIGVLNRWAYVRKDGMHIIWTAQHEARIDKVAREVTDFIWSCGSLGGLLSVFGHELHLQVFHRRKWIPALMTERNRVGGEEGAKGNGLFGLDFEFATWWSMSEAATHYDTYEHVADEGRAEAPAPEGRGAPALRVLAGQGSTAAAGDEREGASSALTRGAASGPRSRLAGRQAGIRGGGRRS